MVPEADGNLAGGAGGADVHQRQRRGGRPQFQRTAARHSLRLDHCTFSLRQPRCRLVTSVFCERRLPLPDYALLTCHANSPESIGRNGYARYYPPEVGSHNFCVRSFPGPGRRADPRCRSGPTYQSDSSCRIGSRYSANSAGFSANGKCPMPCIAWNRTPGILAAVAAECSTVQE